MRIDEVPRPYRTVESTMTWECASWRKSSRSQGAGAECVELAQVPGLVGIRDSKDAQGPRLIISTGAASTLVTAIKTGQHDL